MVRSAILTIVAVGQIVLAFLFYNRDGSITVRNIGWIILWISAVFGWLVGILGAAALVIYYADMFEADKEALAKFGDAYKTYMESVPRANFVLGIFRRLRHTN